MNQIKLWKLKSTGSFRKYPNLDIHFIKLQMIPTHNWRRLIEVGRYSMFAVLRNSPATRHSFRSRQRVDGAEPIHQQQSPALAGSSHNHRMCSSPLFQLSGKKQITSPIGRHFNLRSPPSEHRLSVYWKELSWMSA